MREVSTGLAAALRPAIGGFQVGDHNALDIAMDSLITMSTDNRDETGGSASRRTSTSPASRTSHP